MVFDKIWFEVNQKEVMTLVNDSPFSFIIKKRLNVNGEITAMMPNYFNLGNQLHVYSKDFCAKMLYKTFKYYWNLKHYWDVLIANRYAPYLNLGFDTLTVYPDADPETNTFDGYLSQYNSVYATARSSTTSYVNDVEAGISVYNGYTSGTNKYTVQRAEALFDTSNMGLCTVNSAKLSIYGKSGNSEDDTGQSTTHVVSSNPASNTGGTDTDYGNIGSTSYGSIAYSSITLNVYNEITLNSSGEGAISKTSITKLGLRIDGDLNNNVPIGYNTTQWDSADGTYAPKLVVDYTPPIVASNNIAGVV